MRQLTLDHNPNKFDKGTNKAKTNVTLRGFLASCPVMVTELATPPAFNL